MIDCEKCLEASKKKRQQRFNDEMEEAGFDVELYCGRYYYHGYAVRGDDEQELIRATGVHLSIDSMGKGVIVYPSSESSKDTEEESGLDDDTDEEE